MLRKVSLAYVSLAFLLLLLFSQAVQSSEASQESDDELLRRMSDLCPDCDPDWLVTASDEDIDSLARMLTNSSDTLKSSDGEEVGEEDSSNLWYIGKLFSMAALGNLFISCLDRDSDPGCCRNYQQLWSE